MTAYVSRKNYFSLYAVRYSYNKQDRKRRVTDVEEVNDKYLIIRI